jgi:hypothetical protein
VPWQLCGHHALELTRVARAGNVGHGVWAYNGGFVDMEAVAVNRGLPLAASVSASRPDTAVVLDGCDVDGAVSADDGAAVVRLPRDGDATHAAGEEDDCHARLAAWALA